MLRRTNLQLQERDWPSGVGHKRIDPRPASFSHLLPHPRLVRLETQSRQQRVRIELYEVTEQIGNVHLVRQDPREGLKTGPARSASRHRTQGMPSMRSCYCCGWPS
jgi:hypothetical protein